METKKVNIPKKGAWKKLADRLEEIGKRKPPQDLVDKINGKPEEKKIAASAKRPDRDMEM